MTQEYAKMEKGFDNVVKEHAKLTKSVEDLMQQVKELKEDASTSCLIVWC